MLPAVMMVWDYQSEDHLLVGACLSLASCLIVISSYLNFPRLQRHPAPLIYYRSIADAALAVRFIAGWLSLRYDPDRATDEEGEQAQFWDCQLTAGLTQVRRCTLRRCTHTRTPSYALSSPSFLCSRASHGLR
jgi:hypothetical protein